MQPGKTMRLVEKRRGNADPAPDQLTLDRNLWLEFDGGGYTVHHAISGMMSKSWRLDMMPQQHLGRVAAAGVDQFITRSGNQPLAGVEIRQGQLQNGSRQPDRERIRAPAERRLGPRLPLSISDAEPASWMAAVSGMGSR
jgi:hypothetical protein